MSSAIVIGLILVVRLLVAPSLPSTGQIEQAKPTVKNLMLTPLAKEFTKDREVLIDLVDIPPGTALERHWHPGEEFHYYMEGDVEIKIDGEPSIIGRPGTVGHVPFKRRHQAIAGARGAKILVFRVHTKGEPSRTIE